MSDVERFDILVVSRRRSMRIAPQGVKSLMRSMFAHGYLSAAEESSDEGWAEIYMQPGEGAHGIFHHGETTGVLPVFLEGALYFGSSPAHVLGQDAPPVYFYLAFRGVAFGRNSLKTHANMLVSTEL